MMSHKITRTWRRLILAPACLTSIAVSLSYAQQKPAPRPGSAATPAPAASPTQPSPVVATTTDENGEVRTADDTIMLSPFEVVSDNRGYYSANSMSGTRFNTKLEDLASSITVVTKEQMQDFAMLDINDVFLYTANTEGTGTYTDFSIDRNGQVMDNVQLNPSGANRIRGIAPANVSYGNFETMNRNPIDPTIVDGVEVSRGPNANVFGLGNPSGTVNQVPSAANLTANRSRAELRADSYDGYRSVLDVNRVLIKGKLGVRASGVYQHEGFERKPSGVNTRRMNAMIKYQPFKNTTITGSYLYYKMDGNRPNYTPPRDNVSYWVASGKPGWDPVTQTIHVNGTTLGPFPTDTTLPDYFTHTGGPFQRSNLYIDQTGLAYWAAPGNNTGTTPTANPGTGAANLRLLGSNPAGSSAGRITNQPLFTTTPTVSSKEMYDWSSINLASVNRMMDKTETYLLQLDQVFFASPFHTLAGQVAFFREDSERYQRLPIGAGSNVGQTGQLWVDVNERNLDGTPNPFFGRPYIGVLEPRTFQMPATWDTTRAQLAYRIDFTQNQGWSKWLGRHQISGYAEYKYRVNRTYAFREALTSDFPWTAVGQTGFATDTVARGNQGSIVGGPQAGPNIVRGFFRYYVGDNVGTNVDYAPSDFKTGSYPFVWGTTGNFRRDPANLGLVATTDGAGGLSNLKQVLKTPGAVMQNHLLDDMVVTTFGIRQDKVYSKFGATPQLTDNNTNFDYTATNHWAAGDYRYSSGRTKTAGVVARPFKDLGFLKEQAGSGSGIGRFLADALRGLSLTYNKSDNFIPAPPAVDLYLNSLPNTTGTGKDYGFWLDMMSSKLVIRFNHYINSQHNIRDGDANTIAQRVLRLDLDISNDNYQLYDRATDWVTAANPTWTPDQVKNEVVNNVMKLNVPQYDALVAAFRAGTIAATNDVTATGNELEINYNPTRYWTVAASATETKAVNTNVSTALEQWIAQRMPVWTTIVDPRNGGSLWWTNATYGGSQTAAQNFATFVQAPYSVIKQQESKSRPELSKYNAKLSTNYQLAGITSQPILKKVSIGGAVRWQDRSAIGYYGVEQYPAVITALDANRPIWDKAHYYFDAFVGYKTKMFADRVMGTFRFNVRNIQESGGLRAIATFPDGTPSAYRIVDPRQFILTASFDL